MEEQDQDNAELLALQRIDETCTNFQQNGQYLEALECMERGLVLRQHFFGAGSDEVWRACKTVGEMCNLLAMTYLQQEDFAMVLELLKKAEILTERDPAGRAVTFNNLACYYRRQGKLHAALQYLQKALKIEGRLERVDNPADTYLNACAVLSQLGRHQSALEHAQQALILLQEELSSVIGPAAGGEEGGRLPGLGPTFTKNCVGGEGRLRVKEVLGLPCGGESLVGERVTICGWIKTMRDQKQFAFVELNDGSC